MAAHSSKKLPTETPTPVATECPPDSAGENALPIGLSFESRPGRKKPFLARWREPGVGKKGGRKRSASFATASDRWKFAASWAKRKQAFGKEAVIARPKEVETWRLFAEITGGADPLEVGRWWARNRGIVGGKMTVLQARDAFHAQRKPKGYDTEKHLWLHLDRLCGKLGHMQLGEVTPDHVRSWLAGLKDPETGEGFSPRTLRHHRVSAGLLFSTAVAERWTDWNPVDAVEVPAPGASEGDEGDDGQVNILTVEQARNLFEVNRDALCIGRLALEAFAGMRYTSAARVRYEDINWQEKGITMPGKAHKSGRRHYVDGWPENLWKWLERTPRACWDLSRRDYLRLKREAFERAGLKPSRPADGNAWSPEELAQFEAMRNVLRHSFATYHLAAFRNPQLTLYLMTKKSLTSLNQDYRGRATQVAGANYVAIWP